MNQENLPVLQVFFEGLSYSGQIWLLRFVYTRLRCLQVAQGQTIGVMLLLCAVHCSW